MLNSQMLQRLEAEYAKRYQPAMARRLSLELAETLDPALEPVAAEWLRTGVERRSLYMPYGRHSMREVKEGHQRFQEYRGKTVCGLELLMKTGPSVEVSCIGGTESVFWEHEKNLDQLRQFAGDLQRILH